MSVSSAPPPVMVWHALDPDQVIAALNGDRQSGLTAEEAARRLAKYGPNRLEAGPGRRGWRILWDQFKNVMLLLLLAVAVISAILDWRAEAFPKDAIAILAIVMLNALLGYLQESRAEQALAALRRMATPLVRVMRDRQVQEISAQELVPGDLMLLEAGVQIPADGRLLEAVNLQVREAALTGEATGVIKQAEQPLAPQTPLAERENLVFQGTEVLVGRGTVCVTATGMQTELGKIAAMLESVEVEPTPLQQRLGQLGNVLVTGALALVVLVVVGGILRTGDLGALENLLQVSLSMAVAVVPEGLPAVITVTLALGTQRMVRRQALIRKLPAVETLGSVTTICSDKTGTLTQNKMVVQELVLPGERVQVTGEGYRPEGEFYPLPPAAPEEQPGASLLVSPSHHPDLWLLLLASALCNDAHLQKEAGEWVILGDPTEGALLSLAGKAGIRKDQWEAWLPRIAEIPFNSERKRMSILCRVDALAIAADSLLSAPYQLFTKGSPELVLQHCGSLQQGDRVVPLTPEQRQQVLQANNDMASRGLRVLGLAHRPLAESSPATAPEALEQDLIWLGLVGMLDAPRPEVRVAVAQCRQAGIRPMMITGDHQLTAQAIAADLGIAAPGDRVLSGQELEQLDEAELETLVKTVSIYARVSPEHKLRIVKALQRQQEFVAMTGDGVNDAPALKQADIGIAMGITGTDVSKEASDMILLDDNFATIVAATEEGRVVYTNIRRFIKYILGSNIGEVLTVGAAPLIGLGDVPLTPLQILWMNLVTDGLPALALALEPAEPDVMRRPPYNSRESIFARGLGLYMIRIGVIFALLTIVLMQWAYNYTQATTNGLEPERWRTMVFTTLCLAQMGHALAVRSDRRLTLEMDPFSNPYVLAAVTVTTLLQLMLVYVEPLRNFFGTYQLSLLELSICIGFSALVFVWIELEKLFLRWYRGRRR